MEQLLQNKKILVIDDDKALCQNLEIGLSRQGALVTSANNGQSGLKKFYETHPDLVILDLRMPEMDGWETCRLIRLVAQTPIIMLTSVAQEHEVVRGLRKGADDYVTKPFSHDILLARVAALLRRSSQFTVSDNSYDYDDGYLQIDFDRRIVSKAGERIKLSATEFRLLRYLFDHAGRALTNEAILNNVWGEESQQNVEYVHVYLSRLRTKLEKDPRNAQYIVTEYGLGYRFYKCKTKAAPVYTEA
jgi:DNA-binding response OmpR family regulator